jgi:hypothetical protein
LTAATGYPGSAAAGEEVVKTRLGALEAALAQQHAIRDTATRDGVHERS